MFLLFCHVQVKLQKTKRVEYFVKKFFEGQEQFLNHFLLIITKLTERYIKCKYVA